MALKHFTSHLLLACFTLVISDKVSATAQIGGVVSVLSGLGSCHDNKLVAFDTPQDTFSLSGSAACSGGSATADLHADAATHSIGLRATVKGSTAAPGSSQAAASVSSIDFWIVHVPIGTPIGTISLPVSLTLDGSISSGALSEFNRFLGYNLTISDHYAALSPGRLFSALGAITTTGNFAQTFTGFVNIQYFGPGSALPSRADVELNLGFSGLNEGTVDFFNTASISVALPPGFSVTTSSGLPLFAPVPLPAAVWLLGSALGALGLARRRFT